MYEWLPQLLGNCTMLEEMNRTCEPVPKYKGNKEVFVKSFLRRILLVLSIIF